VRGTMEPLSGWYNSPDDLERVIIEALHWAYRMGVGDAMDRYGVEAHDGE
jgi:hypothetical protein